MVLFTACSSDDEEELSQEEKAIQTQTEVYNNVLSNIVGHWKGSNTITPPCIAPLDGKIFHILVGHKNIFSTLMVPVKTSFHQT